MKSFAISAAILASTVAALPTNIIPDAASGVLPSGIPSCLPSGIIPAGLPIPSGIPTCLPSTPAAPTADTNVGSSAGSAQVSTNQVAGLATGVATGQVHSVLTVTDQASKLVLVELEPTVASLLTGLNLGGLTQSVGQIIQVAPTVSALNLNGATGGLMTFATGDGSVALVQLTSTVGGLLSGLGLPEVGSIVGSLVGTLEGAASGVTGNLKRNSLSDVMTITDLSGNPLLVQVAPTVLGLLGGSLDLSNVQGTVGTVVAEVPAVSGLAAAAENVAADPTQLFSVLGQDGTSALLVKVEGTATGLLSKLGLGDLTNVLGSVVPAGVVPAGIL